MNRSSSVPTFFLSRMVHLLEERDWCQYVMAQDRQGEPCFSEDPNVWSFSLIGAFYWVLDKYPQTGKYREQVLTRIIRVLNQQNAAEGRVKSPSDIIKDRATKSDEWKYHFNRFNDASGRTKMEVVRLLKRAMEN